MYESVFRAFVSTLGNEGLTNWMYCDVDGNVTTGRGNLINSPSAAEQWTWYTPSGRVATPDEVAANWQLVHDRQDLRGGGGGAYDGLAGNTLRLKWEDIDANVDRIARQFASIIEDQVLLVKRLPADAQLGILRWAWAMGPNGVRSRAPKMWTALTSIPPDFDEAGVQSDWRGQTLATKLVLNQLFQNATDAVQKGLPAESLLWTGDGNGKSIRRARGGGVSPDSSIGVAGVAAAAVGAGLVWLGWQTFVEHRKGSTKTETSVADTKGEV